MIRPERCWRITIVAGFMQAMRHEMGRSMMRDALIKSFEAIRANLGG